MAHTMITVAPTGAESSKADVPALPVTIDELVATAQACEAAGAAMIHIHIRDDDAQPTLDLGRLKETVAAVRASSNLVVQLSTGGSVHDGYEPRLRVLDAEPDSCSLTCGTVNFGDEVFMNSWPFMVELYQLTQERQIVPEFELFDLGHVTALNRLLDTSSAPPTVARSTVTSSWVCLVACQARRRRWWQRSTRFPAGASWSATGVGRTHAAGDVRRPLRRWHLRVGMEDVLTVRRGRPGARQRPAGRARRRGCDPVPAAADDHGRRP